MLRRNVLTLVLGVMLSALLVPLSASAQQAQASGIAGVVKDASGAVLPGVIVDLRPGTYIVTFSITGFNSFRRDGIELTSGFTATVNADLKIGALSETVTVTGESPLV